MTFQKLTPDLNEIKEIDMVSYLSSLGHEPTRVRGDNFWYLSPLRLEKEASFKINRRLNRWYDYGMGQGGNIIDFAMRYNQFTIAEFLDSINHASTLKQKRQRAEDPAWNTRSGLRIVENRSLRHDALLNYLQERRISISIADRYLRELHFEIDNKTYFGFGFPNRSGGYEIRNSFMKISSSPKDISTYIRDHPKVAAFEGFMDFLTFRTLHRDLDENRMDFVILNSASFFDRAKPMLEQHQNISLYFDQDQTGRNLTQMALASDQRYMDESNLYKEHKDLNEWACSIGRSKKIAFGSLKIKS